MWRFLLVLMLLALTDGLTDGPNRLPLASVMAAEPGQPLFVPVSEPPSAEHRLPKPHDDESRLQPAKPQHLQPPELQRPESQRPQSQRTESQRPESQQPESQQPDALTLKDFEAIALRHNPTIQGAAARVRAAEGRRFQAGRYPNPVVGYHATEIANVGTAGQQGGFISQRFITAGKLKLDRQIAGQETEQAHFRFHGQEQRVLSDVRVRFFEALAAQERVELTRELAGIGDELVKATQTLVESGLGAENDLLQAEIQADRSRIRMDNARHQLAEAWRRLAAVAGNPRMAKTRLAGRLTEELPAFQWESCYASLLDGHPELNAAEARVQQATMRVLRAKKEPIPNVDLSVSIRHHNVTQSDVANVQLGVPIPVFDRNRGNISAAEAEWLAAKKEVERIRLRLQDRLAVVFRRYASARQQVERYGQRMVPRARKSLNLVTDGYQKGQVEYLTVLNAQETWVNVRLSYLESLRELHVASALINGQLQTESLGNG